MTAAGIADCNRYLKEKKTFFTIQLLNVLVYNFYICYTYTNTFYLGGKVDLIYINNMNEGKFIVSISIICCIKYQYKILPNYDFPFYCLRKN